MVQHLFSDEDPDPGENKDSNTDHRTPSNQVLSIFDETEDADGDRNKPFTLSDSPTESVAETVRRSGLAYSAGIAFVAAVVFMLILGWGADVLLGTTPWGVVAGIILGSIIGFIQLFRISAQIFKK